MIPRELAVEPARALNVEYSAGTAAGTTMATVLDTVAEGNHLVYKIGSKALEMPTKEALISGGTEYTSGSDIAGVDAENNKYISIIEVTASNRAVACNCHELEATEITPVV
jgi:hypothetical protein